jgi:hypothetical protein
MVSSTLGRANGYEVNEITLYSYNSDIEREARGIEISNLVTKFSITESIYFIGVTLDMTIVDGVNIIEKFKLSGNEKIKIKISKFDKHTQTNNEIDLVFVIVDYPLFGKSGTRKYQAFNITGITEHAFISAITSLSKHINGTPSDMIKSILINNLKYDEAKIDATKNANNIYDYIVPNLSPLIAISHILKTSCDSNLSPLLAWETLKGVKIKGYSEIIEQQPYKDRTYSVSVYTDNNSVEEEDLKFLQEITSVLQFSSNLKMSKIEQALGGAFASVSKNYDYSTKTYTETIYDCKQQDPINYISDYTSFTDKFLIDSKALNTYARACELDSITNNSISKNMPLNGKGYIHNKVKNSYLAQAEHITHLIKLHGDLDLSSGDIINLEVPSGNYNEDNSLIDNYFSGKYLIASIRHNFEGSYTMELKIQRDGLNVDLSN